MGLKKNYFFSKRKRKRKTFSKEKKSSGDILEPFYWNRAIGTVLLEP